MDAQSVVMIAAAIFVIIVNVGIVMAIFDIAKQTKATAQAAEKISEQIESMRDAG